MMIITRNELTAYTELKAGTCLRILEAIQRECGEIGNVRIEDNAISFAVYRDYFEDPPKVVRNSKFTLKLLDKFDDPYFRLVYTIQTQRKKPKK